MERFDSSDLKCFSQIWQTIEIARNAKKIAAIAALTATATIFLSSCRVPARSAEYSVCHASEAAYVQSEAVLTEDAPIYPWTDDELNTLAKLLAGECYADEYEDKKLVCEVVLNRVSDGRFGDSVVEVITSEHQFVGYWHQAREITENDYDVAEEALSAWYARGCTALSDNLFFTAGSGHTNQFRKDF